MVIRAAYAALHGYGHKSKNPGNWRIMPDATLAASYQAYKVSRPVGRIRRSRRIRQQITRTVAATPVLRCLMRHWRVLSGLQNEQSRRPDKAFTPHPAISNVHRDCNLPQWFRQHRTIRRLLALIATIQQQRRHRSKRKQGGGQRHVIICQPQRQHHTTAICADGATEVKRYLPTCGT